MSRRIQPSLLAVVGAIAVVLAACGGASASPIADPSEILVQSVQAVQDAKTVHVKVDLTGQVPLDLAGGLLGGGLGGSPKPGASGGTLDIAGTTIEGDIDVADQALQLAFTAPSLLSLSGELIAVDEVAYVKISLLGDKYLKFDQTTAGASPSPSASASPSASPDMVQELRDALGKLSTPPTKLADEQCGDATCYHVQVKLDSTEAAPLASLAPGAQGSGTLDVWVRQNDLRPAQLKLTADATTSGESGNVSATVVFSDWDKAVDIKAPPADQVTDGSSLFPGGLPSLSPDLLPGPTS